MHSELPLIAIIDDDDMVRDSICMLVRTLGMRANGYASAREFLDDPAGHRSDCVVLDVRMPGLSGLELQQRFQGDYQDIPVIFVSGHGDIPMAVQAMRQGALDFLQKPFSEQMLLDRIHAAVEASAKLKREKLERETKNARMSQLTPRERDVLQGIVNGAQNKQIAADLGISIRTVEQHRAQVMRKMRVRTVAELLVAVSGTQRTADQ